jgi:hypothetical protein
MMEGELASTFNNEIPPLEISQMEGQVP